MKGDPIGKTNPLEALLDLRKTELLTYLLSSEKVETRFGLGKRSAGLCGSTFFLCEIFLGDGVWGKVEVGFEVVIGWRGLIFWRGWAASDLQQPALHCVRWWLITQSKWHEMFVLFSEDFVLVLYRLDLESL